VVLSKIIHRNGPNTAELNWPQEKGRLDSAGKGKKVGREKCRNYHGNKSKEGMEEKFEFF
jgi:hypothetical protein